MLSFSPVAVQGNTYSQGDGHLAVARQTRGDRPGGVAVKSLRATCRPFDRARTVIAKFAKASEETLHDQRLEYLLHPMVNKGALVLEERAAQRPSDIGAVWPDADAWPAWTSGPMLWADTLGPARVFKDPRRCQTPLDRDFRISELPLTLAATGGGLTQ